MIKTLITIAILFIAISLYLMVLGYKSRSGEAPGLKGDKLAACPATPNCVCSEYADDAEHVIEPIRLAQPVSDETMGQLKSVIAELGGQVVVDSGTYLATTFASSLFGFVDDVEFRIDRDGRVIHLRSASRVGRGDLGANKKRAEAIRAAFLKRLDNA